MLKINLCLLVILIVYPCILANKNAKKYSKEANEPYFDQVKSETYDPDFRKLQRPFRIAKLNLVWSKAQNVRYLLKAIITNVVINFNCSA